MTPFYTDPWLTVYAGDNRTVLAALPDQSVHCVVTSPPFWGLRDYGTATWEGGDAGCPHRVPATGSTQNKGNNNREGKPFDRVCGKCGATRIDRQLGLEPTPEQYVENMVAVFREVRRVLRDDGTLWLNLGDTFASGSGLGRNDAGRDFTGGGGNKPGSGNPGRQGSHDRVTGLKPKDLVGIPWRVAFALQADGWYLRSDIIWSKPNPMPESVTDRPTKAHEYLFLLAKSERYYFDADAVREPAEYQGSGTMNVGSRNKLPPGTVGGQSGKSYERARDPSAGRNIRSVWTIATQPYPGAHFATFPPKLVEPCILAGTSERGVCPECGAPWRRMTRVAGRVQAHWEGTEQVHAKAAKGKHGATSVIETGSYAVRETTGWKPTCDHPGDPIPATVLDPFGGSGTTAMVAQHLGRRAVLIELNPDYIEQQMKRNTAVPLGLEVA